MSGRVAEDEARRLRVLVLINDLAPGGAQRVATQQAESLDRERFEVELASLELVVAPRALAAGAVPVHRLREDREPRALAAGRLARLVRAFRPDVLHTHLAASGVLGRLLARRAGVPHVVTTLHNLTDWEEKRLHPLRVVDRLTLPIADRVVTVSDAVRHALVARRPDLAPRALTVHNGVDVERFLRVHAAGAAARERLGYARSDFVVGTIARLEPRKGVDVLLEAAAVAAARVPSLRVLVVGDGPERGRLEARARERGIADRVRFAGDQRDVVPFLGAMDLFAAPSRTEGLGIAALEAMAAERAVLASRVGGLPEIVRDRVTGWLIEPDDASQWAQSLAQLAGRRDDLVAFGRAGRRRSFEFSTDAARRRLETLYDGLAGRSAAGEAARAAA